MSDRKGANDRRKLEERDRIREPSSNSLKNPKLVAHHVTSGFW